MTKNSYAHFTAKEREKISYPARLLFEKNKLKGKVLDFGCGYGKDVEKLQQKNISVVGYDPHYFPLYPQKKFDTIICIYVLNVLFPQAQAEVLHQISNLLKLGGKAYFVVRRDVKYPGFRMHKIHKKQTYQCNVELPFTSILKMESFEIYEYQHYCYIHKGKVEISPFFADAEIKTPVGEIAGAFAIKDKFPVSVGHSLVIPKRKVSDYFELSFKEQSSLWFLVNQVKKELQKEYSPDGFNIGINSGETAGQTVPHCHIHIIPRYKGDVENPRGGVRGVIPDKKDYLNNNANE